MLGTGPYAGLTLDESLNEGGIEEPGTTELPEEPGAEQTGEGLPEAGPSFLANMLAAFNPLNWWKGSLTFLALLLLLGGGYYWRRRSKKNK